MTIQLNLLTLRDILTDWETSAALNAARYHEARQQYYVADLGFRKRIVPIELANSIREVDPQGTILLVHLRTVPPAVLVLEDFARWTTTPHYGVVWSAHDYPKSLEYRINNSAMWAVAKEEHFARTYEADRLVRMATTITKLLPPVKDMINHLRGLPDEEAIRRVIAVFESATNVSIYEAPNETTQASPSGAGSLQQGKQETSSSLY